METKQLNIYQRLLAISTEIEKVAKNLTVKAGNETYKAVGEGDVLVAVKPLEDSYGLLIPAQGKLLKRNPRNQKRRRCCYAGERSFIGL